MIGSQVRSLGKAVPTDVLVAATKDPDAFEAKIRRWEAMRDEAVEAQNEQRRLIEEVRSEVARIGDERKALDAARSDGSREAAEQRAALVEQEKALNEAHRRLNEASERLRKEQEEFAAEQSAFRDEVAVHRRRTQAADADRVGREEVLRHREQGLEQRAAGIQARDDRLKTVEQALRAYFG